MMVNDPAMSNGHNPALPCLSWWDVRLGTAQLLREESIPRFGLRKMKAFVVSEMESFASPLFQ